jgi:hypothetical protein
VSIVPGNGLLHASKIHRVGRWVAGAGAPGPALVKVGNINAIIEALIGVGVTSIVLVTIFRAHQGRLAKIVETVVVIIAATYVAWLGHGSNFQDFSQKLWNNVFG